MAQLKDCLKDFPFRARSHSVCAACSHNGKDRIEQQTTTVMTTVAVIEMELLWNFIDSLLDFIADVVDEMKQKSCCCCLRVK
jgi:N-acetyl-beta-hexosaminidase